MRQRYESRCGKLSIVAKYIKQDIFFLFRECVLIVNTIFYWFSPKSFISLIDRRDHRAIIPSFHIIIKKRFA